MALDSGWKKIQQFFTSHKADVKKGSEELVKKTAGMAKGIMIRRMKSSQVPGPRLDPSTKKEKAKRGLDSRKLIATGGMLKSIDIHQISKTEAFIGPSEEYKDISLHLEFGTENMPARPNVKVSMQEMEKRIPGAIVDVGFEYTGKKSGQ